MEEYQKVIADPGDPMQCSVKASHMPEQKRAFAVLAALVKILHYGPGGDGDRNDSLVGPCVSLYQKEARLDPVFINK